MSLKAQRGMFIVLEGADKSGKSSQCIMIKNALNDANLETIAMSFPYRESPTGRVIDKFLKKEIKLDEKSKSLLFSANRWDMSNFIIKTLKNGKNIICDRYIMSGLIYNNIGNDISPEWLKILDKGLPEPDITVYLQINPFEFMKRKNNTTEHGEFLSFQTEVIAKYDKLCQSNSYNIVTLDGSKPKLIILNQILNIIFSDLPKIYNKPIKGIGI